VIGDAEQDNFLLLPDPGVNARLERLLSTIQVCARSVTSASVRVKNKHRNKQWPIVLLNRSLS
jgi:hypothetical protein